MSSHIPNIFKEETVSAKKQNVKNSFPKDNVGVKSIMWRKLGILRKKSIKRRSRNKNLGNNPVGNNL